MLRKLVSSLLSRRLIRQPINYLCSSKPLGGLVVSDAFKDDKQFKIATKDGALSVFSQIEGVKGHGDQEGQMYVLKFTCTKCDTQQVKSFTKQAYHNGVVLIRCNGCQNIHLIADNLGWFDDNTVNIETMFGDKLTKVDDPAAVYAFLKAAYQQPDANLPKINLGSKQGPKPISQGRFKIVSCDDVSNQNGKKAAK